MKFDRSKITLFLLMLACAPVSVWSQDFGISYHGSVYTNACAGQDKSYQYPERGYALGKCPKPNAALVQSSAVVSLNLLGSSAQATAINGQGKAYTTTFDTATLFPPADFDGTSVKFTLIDDITYDVVGNGGLANIQACWAATGLFHDCLAATGKGQLKLTKVLTVAKSSSGFQFEFRRDAHALVSAPPKKAAYSAYYVTGGEPYLKLPKGWTCTWASGEQC
ncbi:MAG TPA: hypothetical protein VEI52_10580 [Terriglobales bacterium]|nr:hypothetical protein [Terriglobales bacterium]